MELKFIKPLTYFNGLAKVTIESDTGKTGGTRLIEIPDDKNIEDIIEYPFNIDIRLSDKCPLGYNPKTKSAICSFCHESARTDGKQGDLNYLKTMLDTQIPKGMHIELAVGVNEINSDIADFFDWANNRGFIINATINQLSVASNKKSIEIVKGLIDRQSIKGLGISFRNLEKLDRIPKEILSYPSTVFHVISGIDDIDDVKKLATDFDVKKVLVLGEKNFGFNTEQFNSENNRTRRAIWHNRIGELFPLFDIVSFDNLGVEQLDLRRFVRNQKDWDTFYQGEYSMYINLVDKYFSTSSRSNFFVSSDKTNIRDFFQKHVLKRGIM